MRSRRSRSGSTRGVAAVLARATLARPRAALVTFGALVAATLAPTAGHAATYHVEATVVSVTPGASAGPWETNHHVGQALVGHFSFEETLPPTGFVDPGMTIVGFDHPYPRTNPLPGVLSIDGAPDVWYAEIHPHDVQRGVAGTDFVTRFGARENATGPGFEVDIDVIVRLGDIGGWVDPFGLPHPLTPPVPQAGNEIELRANGLYDPACAAEADCVLVARIDVFYDGPDADRDGVADGVDNCVLTPNGWRLGTGSCVDQEDGDADGYGNICDADANNDDAVGLDDVAQYLDNVALVTTNPAMDIDCDGAIGLDDLVVSLTHMISLIVPGPSGLPCAGTAPCP